MRTLTPFSVYSLDNQALPEESLVVTGFDPAQGSHQIVCLCSNHMITFGDPSFAFISCYYDESNSCPRTSYYDRLGVFIFPAVLRNRFRCFMRCSYGCLS